MSQRLVAGLLSLCWALWLVHKLAVFVGLTAMAVVVAGHRAFGSPFWGYLMIYAAGATASAVVRSERLDR